MHCNSLLHVMHLAIFVKKNVLLKIGVVIKGMHRAGGWDHKDVMLAPI